MASRPPKPPDAFLSYTRFDDENDGGAISEFRKRLAGAVRAVTGEPFDIFQDVDGIGLGQHWRGELDRRLDEVRFFIPILTPSYFKSQPCRWELEKFLRAEAERKRNDLVLPIYYRESDVLDEEDLRAADPLASRLHERQRQDWHELRYSSFRTRQVRTALDKLAKEIVRARRRPMSPSPVKDADCSKLEYHNPELTGRVTFNYSNNNGLYSIGREEFFFETKWSQASDQSIHLYNDPPSIIGIAEAPELRSYMDLLDLESYDMSSRARTIHEGEHAILKNRHNKYAVLKVADVKDRTRSDTIDELTFEFWILTDNTSAEHKANGERSRAGFEMREQTQEVAAKRGVEEEALRQAEQAAEPPQTKKLLKPGTVFRKDAPWCPELVVIPPGEFMMGSTEAERQWAKPQHRVSIAYSLAVGRYAVTFEEYDHFAKATGSALPADKGWGRSRRPVIHVSWDEAKAYVAWLGAETGQAYRLLSEAEWEYACRAGTTTQYWWGDEITPKNANYGRNVGKTSEVGTYPVNPFGLYDMHGNVWEWVEDCWNDSYKGAPDDGSAWTSSDCRRRVLRGGSWSSPPEVLRSAHRYWNNRVKPEYKAGFRVARTLSRITRALLLDPLALGSGAKPQSPSSLLGI